LAMVIFILFWQGSYPPWWHHTGIFTSGEVNFNNSIIDHFRLSDSDHTQTSLRKYTIGYPEIFSHTAVVLQMKSSFFKKGSSWRMSVAVGEVGWRSWLLVQHMWFLKAVNARELLVSTKSLMAEA